MVIKLFVALLTTLLCVAGNAQASPDEIVYSELSLAGYSIGMSYDEAVSVRPLFYAQNPKTTATDSSLFDAFTDSVYLDDVALDIRISFKNERVYKVVARFSRSALESLSNRFQDALGEAEDKSKTLETYDGKVVRQTAFFWEFPNAKMYLVSASYASDYATLALIAKDRVSGTSENNT